MVRQDVIASVLSYARSVRGDAVDAERRSELSWTHGARLAAERSAIESIDENARYALDDVLDAIERVLACAKYSDHIAGAIAELDAQLRTRTILALTSSIVLQRPA